MAFTQARWAWKWIPALGKVYVDAFVYPSFNPFFRPRRWKMILRRSVAVTPGVTIKRIRRRAGRQVGSVGGGNNDWPSGTHFSLEGMR